ncbi:MAG: Fic family protein [Dehalococcoidia bacterium]|nr:Fic family protein [Dehalococcoidia bacterium]
MTDKVGDMPEWEVTFDLDLDLQDAVLNRALIEATALARAIHGLLPPAVRARLNRLNIIRAVHGTTGIEGSTLSEEEVGQILGSASAGRVLPMARAREEQEARNAASVLEFVSATLRAEPDRPLDEAMICRIHELTTLGIDYPNNEPGKYRSHAVTAGDYVPPRSASDVRRLMGLFVRWLNTPPASNWPPIARAIAAHFYFISVHPFGDGNGRTARSLESFLLYQAKVNALGFYSLANFYYRNRASYVERLDDVRFGAGGLTSFVSFAAEGLVDELRASFDEVLAEATLIAFRDYAREQLDATGKSGTPAGTRLTKFLTMLGRDVIDFAAIRRRTHPYSQAFLGVSDKTLTRDMEFLETHNLIDRSDGKIRARLDVMDQFKD